MAKIIDGKALAAKLRAELKEQIENFGEPITLAVVMAGENPASQVYVRNKVKACAEVGVRSVSRILPENCTQEDLEATLTELADDESVNGILLQLPLPANLDERSALKKIPVEKDVDGFSEENVGKLAMNRGGIAACTPLGVMKMLESAGTEICGKRAVVIGRSNTVGRPMAMLLLNADATVTVCHSKTQNLKEICREADILIAAIGKKKFVTADMVKDGAVVGMFQKRPMSELETIADGMELPLLAGENVQFILIYGMNESAGNAFMEKTFSADVAISATQYTYEKDGFGSDQYDKDADPFVMFGKDIVDALQDPDVSEVVAGEDIDMNRGEFQRPNGNVTVIIPDGKTLDLNQNTIIRPEGGSGDGLSFEAGTTATVKNGTVYAQGDMKAVDVSEGASVTFENMAFEGHGNEILKVRAKSGVKTTVVFRNCTFNNAPITLSGRDGATEIDIQFIDCIFTGTYKMYDDEGNALTDPYGNIHYTQYMINAASSYLYGDVRIENCTFDFDASEARYSEEIIELYGCYQSSYPGKMLNVLLKDVTMTGNNVTPVDVDSRYTNGIVLTEEGTNTYTVDGVQVNYDGSAK